MMSQSVLSDQMRSRSFAPVLQALIDTAQAEHLLVSEAFVAWKHYRLEALMLSAPSTDQISQNASYNVLQYAAGEVCRN